MREWHTEQWQGAARTRCLGAARRALLRPLRPSLQQVRPPAPFLLHTAPQRPLVGQVAPATRRITAAAPQDEKEGPPKASSDKHAGRGIGWASAPRMQTQREEGPHWQQCSAAANTYHGLHRGTSGLEWGRGVAEPSHATRNPVRHRQTFKGGVGEGKVGVLGHTSEGGRRERRPPPSLPLLDSVGLALHGRAAGAAARSARSASTHAHATNTNTHSAAATGAGGSVAPRRETHAGSAAHGTARRERRQGR